MKASLLCGFNSKILVDQLLSDDLARRTTEFSLNSSLSFHYIPAHYPGNFSDI